MLAKCVEGSMVQHPDLKNKIIVTNVPEETERRGCALRIQREAQTKRISQNQSSALKECKQCGKGRWTSERMSDGTLDSFLSTLLSLTTASSLFNEKAGNSLE